MKNPIKIWQIGRFFLRLNTDPRLWFVGYQRIIPSQLWFGPIGFGWYPRRWKPWHAWGVTDEEWTQVRSRSE